jgi:hypothetical protein
VVFDSGTGLYHGETSFLDWREQSYPGWMATDTAHTAEYTERGCCDGDFRFERQQSAL